MDNTQIAFVQELAYKYPESLAVSNAKSILLMLYEEEAPDCIEIETRNSEIMLKDINFVMPDSDAYMEDNFPDPFTDRTLVNYYLPEGINGEIRVNDMYGKTVANYKLKEGENSLEIFNNNWSPGIYTYTMFANDKLIEVKKMIITHR
ncbi:MAG: T9SS type A sorting domain-containing protein [Bacteroidales bacterium]|nr:T9SS type A sorting domain-containing protein [Bacteroidales bacterium]